MVKAILKHLALAMVDGLAPELHVLKEGAPGAPQKAKKQAWFIPFTQPRGAVMHVKHGTGKRANVRDEFKSFLMMEWWMVKSGSYPGTVADLAAHYQLHPRWYKRTQMKLQAEHTLTSNRTNCGAKRKWGGQMSEECRVVNREWKRRASQKILAVELGVSQSTVSRNLKREQYDYMRIRPTLWLKKR